MAKNAWKLQTSSDIISKSDGILRRDDICDTLWTRHDLDYYCILFKMHEKTWLSLEIKLFAIKILIVVNY